MILDKIENSSLYSGMSKNLEKGFDFLRTANLHDLQPGKYTIQEEDVFALVSEYETKAHELCHPEAHRKYADIQFLISGKELIGFSTLSNQKESVPYDETKDLVFYSSDTDNFILEQGMFAVFFPQDIHRPCMQASGSETVKKVVVKIRM